MNTRQHVARAGTAPQWRVELNAGTHHREGPAGIAECTPVVSAVRAGTPITTTFRATDRGSEPVSPVT